MKRFLLVSLFLFSTSVFAQQTIDFETVGNNWVWNLFSAGAGGLDTVVANPNPSGLNTSANCLKIVVGLNGDPWAGVYCTEFPDMLITADNCIVKILVYKDVTSRFNLKLEPPNVDHFDSNTVVNQWQELTFDYSSAIGTTGITLTLIPDMDPGPRVHASVNYMDDIRFTPQVVPVELTSFTGAFVGNNVELKWSTATELNNRGFEIQRSSSNSEFITVGFVEGNGTTTEQHHYTYKDKDVSGFLRYRLKQVDYNGNFEYYNLSGIAEIGIPAKFNLSQNYPNPFNPTTKINFDIPNDSRVNITVYDIAGRDIKTIVNEFKNAGYYTVQFDASGMSSGIYFCKLQTSDYSSIIKMMLLK